MIQQVQVQNDQVGETSKEHQLIQSPGIDFSQTPIKDDTKDQIDETISEAFNDLINEEDQKEKQVNQLNDEYTKQINTLSMKMMLLQVEVDTLKQRNTQIEKQVNKKKLHRKTKSQDIQFEILSQNNNSTIKDQQDQNIVYAGNDFESILEQENQEQCINSARTNKKFSGRTYMMLNSPTPPFQVDQNIQVHEESLFQNTITPINTQAEKQNYFQSKNKNLDNNNNNNNQLLDFEKKKPPAAKPEQQEKKRDNCCQIF